MKRNASRQDVLRALTSNLAKFLPEIREAISANRPIAILGDTYYFQPFYGVATEAILVKTYWSSDLSGLAWLKHQVRSRLLKIFNEW
jgi:hypothetical protein